jgi:hypothetical protein
MRYLNRTRRRGSILGTVMLFFVVVTIAGASLLAMSLISQESMIRSSVDVRLLIAAEAGIETVRGRFALVEGVQDHWEDLLPIKNDWNNIGGPMTINGLQVQAQAYEIGTPAVPRARLRAIATLRDRNRVVEYVIRIPSLSDYTIYSGAGNSINLDANFKVWGNFYAKADINLANRAGIEFYGEVTTSGRINNAPDPAYNFKLGYEENVPLVEFPPTARAMEQMRDAAVSTGRMHFGNTLGIRFLEGNLYERTYYRRVSSGTDARRTEILEVPDDSVIYVSRQNCPPGVDTDVAGQTPSNATGGERQLRVSGTLGKAGAPEEGARVSLAYEYQVLVDGNMTYQSLLENPELRRIKNKKSDEALGYREMLGIVAQDVLYFYPRDWASLTVGNGAVPSYADEGEPHLANQCTLDGVFLSLVSVNVTGSSPTGRELWLNGGLLSGQQNPTYLSSHFDLRNYHTDYRLQYTMPPYFLRAYGDQVLIERGSWQTYSLPSS